MTREALQDWARQIRKEAPDEGISPRRDGDTIVYYVKGRPELGEYRQMMDGVE